MTMTTSAPVTDATTGTWTVACAGAELEPLWGETVLLAGRQIALIKLSDDELYAVGNQDPHTGAFVMARGIVGSRGDIPTIASPLHKEVYDLRTGAGLSNPALRIDSYPSRIVDGVVEVQLP
ncbi:nitrite reductase small subunit NirD [Marisediminicola senii]|uniref:nitrite reductase small subunit NirD n=1 Tax=Marisediminicola senii TaxID=2711233 RepID=UPI0013ED74F8|nr:nitrite reductase small subunit NirD [Marisediminicola senii]